MDVESLFPFFKFNFFFSVSLDIFCQPVFRFVYIFSFQCPIIIFILNPKEYIGSVLHAFLDTLLIVAKMFLFS